MCTLIVLDRVLPGVPLVVASNRDEYLSRPAAPPALVRPPSGGGIPLVAPQDLEGGGTWMGVNARGLFVGLTNRPAGRKDPDHRSRGLLVVDALGEPSAPRVVERVRREMRERAYNPFHLLCADGQETWRLSLREEGLAALRLEPGLQVLANLDPEDPADTKGRRIRERLAHLDATTPLEEALDALRAVLAEHSPDDPLEGVCVHRGGYGTRSSGLFALGDSGWRFWYAEGPPCETKYRDLTPLLEGLWPGQRSEGEVIEANR